MSASRRERAANISPPDCLLIGVGNWYRCDDGVGVYVIRQLMKRGGETFKAIECSGEGTELMAAWEHSNYVILVDAVRTGSSPGTIHRLDAHKQTIPSEFFHYSTHAFSVAEAVEMSRALDGLPEQFVIYGIEGAGFGSGTDLSPAVRAAARVVERRVWDEVMTGAVAAPHLHSDQ